MLLALAASGLPAQMAGVSVVSGRISDPKDASVAGAKVTLEQTDGGFQRETRTNDAGQYLFPPAPAGTYRIQVEAAGFVVGQASNLKVDIATPLVQDFQLSLGPLTTVVEVRAAAPMLQTGDASIGSTISGEIIRRLPNFSRDTSELFFYQPGVQPYGYTTGAQHDQNSVSIDGGDISDVNWGFWVPPLPAESVDEFRALVANPSGSLGTGSGAQFHLQTKRGSNEFHGSVYWYVQNEALNANSWESNRLGQGKDHYRKNLYGASAGGPVWKSRTYFYAHYEGSRLQSPVAMTSLVPSDTLRQGLLRFRDTGGEVHTIDPKEYDPRGLGANPVILQVLREYPAGNDPSQGDGLNTAGLTFSAARLFKREFGLLRLDHDLNEKWRLEASGRLQEWEVPRPRQQMDLIARRALERETFTPRYVTAAATGVLSSRLTARLQFSWVQDRGGSTPGSDARIAPLDVASDLGANLLAELIGGVNPPWNAYSSNYFQPAGQLHWQKGAHQIQGGFSLRDLRRSDLSRYRPYAAVGAAQQVAVPARQRPAFLRPVDVRRYNVLYSTLLGIVDSVSEVRVRNARLEPLLSGTGSTVHPGTHIWEYFLQDVWRARPSLTITYGLTYGWQTAPAERDGLQLMPIYKDTGELIDPRRYLDARRAAARTGEVYNPGIAFQPVRNLGRETTYETNHGNIAPRISAAWSPSFERGLLGKIFGTRKGVLRGGYGLLYDRTNLTTSFDLPRVGIGFTESLTLSPRNSQSQPFRVGIDGPMPLPEMAPATAPIVPGTNGSQYLTSSLDPHLRTPRNHEVTFGFQRELPGGVVVEAAYVGRMARRLYSTINLNNFPYMFRDPISGQAFAEAFDGVAAQLRAGVAPEAVTAQPWFENLLPGVGTQGVAAEQAGSIITGDIGSLGLYLNGLTAEPLMNQQAQMIMFRTSEGRSNYHGAILSVNKRLSHGLQLSANYTFSESLDQPSYGQYDWGLAPNSYDLDAGYGPSFSDHRHVLSGLWFYELPFGRSRRFLHHGGWVNKLAGGWYLSGIVSSYSGDPMDAYFSPQPFGGGEWAYAAGAVPLTKPRFDNDVHRTSGSGGIGSGADPAAGGTGLNRFADPEAMFKNFRPIRLAADGRGGRGDLRGYVSWNLDLGAGKMTRLSEKVQFGLTFEFMNVLNQMIFGGPSLDLNDPAQFGVLGWQMNSPRRIQLGARLEW